MSAVTVRCSVGKLKMENNDTAVSFTQHCVIYSSSLHIILHVSIDLVEPSSASANPIHQEVVTTQDNLMNGSVDTQTNLREC